ncbi:hypothetical protein DSO57_1011156 [Entomophthora muscae]|uniref:Uncharacterized protein n=1 Tax=Entomophthora muscae TaxID=34485 RepID=A0ACC2SVI3_9FUNG|nr:hypothetical protein DSO57_1011156 [Entomophthora muscae]
MKSIRTLLQDIHLTHSGEVVQKNCAASSSGLSSCGPCILKMNLQNPPRYQGCHNSGQIGHHSKVCTNHWVEGAERARAPPRGRECQWEKGNDRAPGPLEGDTPPAEGPGGE